MTSRATLAVLVLMAATVTACRIERTPRADPDDPANVARAEIELSLRNFQEALVAGDARAAAAVFTPDAHLYMPDAPAVTGRGEIDAAVARRFAAESILEMDMRHDRIDVAGGVAHLFGTMHQRVRDPGGAERDQLGRFATRWVRAADSAWRIDRLLVNYAPAPDTSAMAPAEESPDDS